MHRDRDVHLVRLATGVAVPYISQGEPSGVPVILLHSWGESLGCFDRLLLPAVHALAMDQERPGRVAKDLADFVQRLDS
jgi:pimeloyl-ACP methyl ester carboxylesterase